MSNSFQISGLDLRTSYSDEMIIVEAKDGFEFFTDEQRNLWHLFYGDNKPILPLPKENIIPSNMVKALPNIWMYDVVYDGRW
jgi:hypothetical protein